MYDEYFPGKNYHFMMEFSDMSLWEDLERKVDNENYDDDIWFGLIVMNDKAWWASGREIQGD